MGLGLFLFLYLCLICVNPRSSVVSSRTALYLISMLLLLYLKKYRHYLFTDRYLNGVPEDSRLSKANTSLVQKFTPEVLEKAKKLNVIAQKRGQKLSQLALAWLLHNEAVTTILIGASRPSQIEENVKALDNLTFTEDELKEIESILK